MVCLIKSQEAEPIKLLFRPVRCPLGVAVVKGVFGVSSCVCDCCIVAEVIRCARVRTEYMALPPNEGEKHKELVLKADYDWVVKE